MILIPVPLQNKNGIHMEKSFFRMYTIRGVTYACYQNICWPGRCPVFKLSALRGESLAFADLFRHKIP